MSGITNPAEAFFKDGVWGWNGTAWHKLPLLFGYSEPFYFSDRDTNATADWDTLTTGAVPAGEIWIVTSISARDDNSNITQIAIFHSDGVSNNIVAQVFPTVAEQCVIFTGWLVLSKDDTIWAGFTGTVLNDDIYLNASGFKMKIAE